MFILPHLWSKLTFLHKHTGGFFPLTSFPARLHFLPCAPWRFPTSLLEQPSLGVKPELYSQNYYEIPLQCDTDFAEVGGNSCRKCSEFKLWCGWKFGILGKKCQVASKERAALRVLCSTKEKKGFFIVVIQLLMRGKLCKWVQSALTNPAVWWVFFTVGTKPLQLIIITDSC